MHNIVGIVPWELLIFRPLVGHDIMVTNTLIDPVAIMSLEVVPILRDPMARFQVYFKCIHHGMADIAAIISLDLVETVK